MGVRRALIIVLSGYAAGDTVCYSEIFPALRARDLSVERAAEVLSQDEVDQAAEAAATPSARLVLVLAEEADPVGETGHR